MPKISRVLGTAAAVGAIALLGPAPFALAQGGVHSAATADKDCGDFQYQEDAQAVLDADPSDPNRLDADNDGKACETLPHRAGQAATTKKPATTTKTAKSSTSAQVKVKPVGGVDTGGGDSTGGTGSDAAAFTLGGIALAGTAGAGTLFVMRRRAQR
ncbi:calcium-binding protein [Amycolatopsis sp. GM8]|uniref:calcium-binding protein n=1 Tax=Amycolatopsis sp. GM8 TaxID=2896530 RepID=UPI001F456CE2|nr:calcium-binding protein [Amycolatopsis sp. GM8]